MINRLAVIVMLFLISAGSGVAQTLTVNKVREPVTPLDPLSNSIAIPIVYRITITSSDPLKSPLVKMTDILPAIADGLPSSFRVVGDIACEASGTAVCPAEKIAFTQSPNVNNPIVIDNLRIPAGASSAIVLRVKGYFVAPSPKDASFKNVVEVRRQDDETTIEPTATDEIAAVISDEPVPVDLGVTKTVSPVSGTATPGVARTKHTFNIEVKNAGPTDVYLSPFKLTDAFVPNGSFEATIDNFVCTHAACPTLPRQTGGCSHDRRAEGRRCSGRIDLIGDSEVQERLVGRIREVDPVRHQIITPRNRLCVRVTPNNRLCVRALHLFQAEPVAGRQWRKRNGGVPVTVGRIRVVDAMPVVIAGQIAGQVCLVADGRRRRRFIGAVGETPERRVELQHE